MVSSRLDCPGGMSGEKSNRYVRYQATRVGHDGRGGHALGYLRLGLLLSERLHANNSSHRARFIEPNTFAIPVASTAHP